MANTFEILTRFMDRFGDEVEGRELQEPAEDVKARIRALARGDLPAAELREIFGILSRNPHWIGRLAEEVKTLRKSPG